MTHLGVATDHVIESFRNGIWPGYKSSAGLDPQLLGQFGLLEVALEAMGVVVWPMVELEADDALASAAAVAADDPRVEQVVICTPDKDLSQCVRDGRVVQLDRRNKVVYDEARVAAKFGVGPPSIPDYLALVGDSADGYPGLPGWGARSAATVLARYGRIEQIPDSPGEWTVPVRNRPALAATLRAQRPRPFCSAVHPRSSVPCSRSTSSLGLPRPLSPRSATARRRPWPPGPPSPFTAPAYCSAPRSCSCPHAEHHQGPGPAWPRRQFRLLVEPGGYSIFPSRPWRPGDQLEKAPARADQGYRADDILVQSSRSTSRLHRCRPPARCCPRARGAASRVGAGGCQDGRASTPR